ncbi:MAG: hypothetical protein PHP42_13635 [Bacteroidota bacterium]|nr:hypothetical protein [Bacteroidota bacterium]
MVAISRLILHIIILGIFLLTPALYSAGGDISSTRMPPNHLSETGLYVNINSKTIAPENLSFAPQYPLWSDGAMKKRWIYLPPKQTIDAKHIDDWVFPVGTKFWKEFSFGKRVETRYLEKISKSSWNFATYIWNDDETEAVLVSENGLKNYVQIAAGIRHDIPGKIDCKACHEGQGRDVVLGFNALQLSPARDPNALHSEPVTHDMINFNDLIRQKRISNVSKRFIDKPPMIEAATPRERAALGYLTSNCGGCHNSTDPLSSVGMFLKYKLTNNSNQKKLSTVIGHTSKYKIPTIPGDQSFRILSGDPTRSVVTYRMGTRNPYIQMPPLGTKIIDTMALNLITNWIKEDLTKSETAQFFHNQ